MGYFILCRRKFKQSGQNLYFDCCRIFHGTTIHCLLVVMTTVKVAPHFRLFLFIAMLNGSKHNLKRTKFPYLWCIIIFCNMLREVDVWLKCTFFHLITLKNKNGSPNVNKYCQQYLHPPFTNKKSAPFYFWNSSIP
jgi:hypothetical protein